MCHPSKVFVVMRFVFGNYPRMTYLAEDRSGGKSTGRGGEEEEGKDLHGGSRVVGRLLV